MSMASTISLYVHNAAAARGYLRIRGINWSEPQPGVFQFVVPENESERRAVLTAVDRIQDDSLDVEGNA